MHTLYLEDYEVTRDGQVINKHNGHIKKPQPNQKGYLRVWMSGKMVFVHRLVATIYVPNPDNKPQVNHKDGNKLNNSADNLEWVTNIENRKHAVEKGLHLCGEKVNTAKLKESDVIFIRTHKDEYTINEFASKYGVTRTAIESVLKNKTWKQLKSYAELSRIESDRSKG